MEKGKGMLLLMGGDKEDEEYEDEGGTEEVAMKNLRTALKSGDDKAGVSAMKAFLEACYPQLASDDDSE